MRYILVIVVIIVLLSLGAPCKTLQGGASQSRELGMVGLTRGICNKVVRVIRYSPAWLSDVQPGDIIISVDGKKNKDCTGDPGSIAKVVFKRGDRLLNKDIKRSPESEVENLARKYGYIKP